MVSVVERLEKCLRGWEDFWFIAKVLNSVISENEVQMPLLNESAIGLAPIFRRKLLNIHQESFNLQDFLPTDGCWLGYGHPVPTFPSYLYPWCQHSRRVYAITRELQEILNATSLEGVNWQDIQFPFPAYAISLEQPIVRCDGRCYDFIVVHSYELKEGDRSAMVIRLALFSNRSEDYQPLTVKRRNEILAMVTNREWRRLSKLCNELLEKVRLVSFTDIAFNGKATMGVIETAQKVYDEFPTGDKEKSVPMWDAMIRIVVGMCLYLKTLPPESPHQSDWRPASRTGLPDPRAISHEAKVCTISSCYQLTREERIMLGIEGTTEQRAVYELSCHFRQGHWRRAPGHGSFPDAPKTVHVRPCIVRKDRLREGQLPGGSEAQL